MIDDLRESLSNSIPCGLFSFKEDGTIVTANIYFSQLLGYMNGELIGKNINSALGIAARIFYSTHLYPIIKMHGRADEIFIKFRSLQGTDMPVMLNAVIIDFNGEKLISCACMSVSNRGAYESELLAAKKKAEDQLEQHYIASGQKEKDEIQSEIMDKQARLVKQQHNELIRLGVIISHDLQEPLRKLNFYSSELQKKQRLDGSNEKALTIIKKSASQIRHRLLQLQSYLDISRDVDLGEEVLLASVVDTQLQHLCAHFPEVVIDFFSEGLQIVKGNNMQLNTLFHELIKNALVHGTIKKHLRLEIKAVIIKENVYHTLSGKYSYKDHLQVTLSDSGNGFDMAHVGYVFEILNNMGESGAPLGVGLSICKRIVDVHGGKIWTDGNPGRGAKFFFTLPL